MMEVQSSTEIVTTNKPTPNFLPSAECSVASLVVTNFSAAWHDL